MVVASSRLAVVFWMEDTDPATERRDEHENNKYLGRQANTNTFLGKHWNWIKYPFL